MATTSEIAAINANLQSQLQTLINDILSWRPTTFTLEDPTDYVPDQITLGFNGTAPSAPHVADTPNAPALELGTVSTIDPKLPDTWDGSFQSTEIAAPESLPTKTFEAPEITLGVAPLAPAIATENTPALSDVPLPEPLNLTTLPVFTATAPSADSFPNLPFTDNPLATFNASVLRTRQWQSVDLDTLTGELKVDILQGRTGIPADVEQQIWDRQAERDLMALNDALKLQADTFSKQCFTMPPGKLDRKRNELIANYMATKNDRSREIAQNQAERTFENRKFAITTLTEIEKAQMQFAMQYAGLLLDVAKETVNAGIAIYNAYLARYTAQLEGYKTEAQVFEARLRAFSTQIEIYKGELEAARLRGDLNLQQIEIYKAKLSAQELLAKIYTTQVEGYVAASTVEKLKIDIFKSKIDAYQAEIQGKVAEYQGYEARLRGEEERLKAYEAEISTFRAKTDSITAYNQALSAKVDAEARVVQAKAENNKIKLAEFQGELDKTRFTNEFALEMYKAELETFFSQLKVELAKADVNKFNIDTALKRWEVLKQVVTNRASIMEREVLSENSMKVSSVDAGIKGIGTIMSSLASIDLKITKPTT